MMMFRTNKPGGDTAEDIFDKIQSDIYDAYELLGAQIADAWRERISVDVEYVRGPRGGIITIRSKRGEAPRRDTQALYDSIEARTEVDDAVITEYIDTDRFYAPILEEKLDRPHFEVTFDEWVDEAINATIHAIETPTSGISGM